MLAMTRKNLSFRTFLSSDVILIRNLIKTIKKIPAFAGMTGESDKVKQIDSGF
jgi:hypothetical protein